MKEKISKKEYKEIYKALEKIENGEFDLDLNLENEISNKIKNIGKKFRVLRDEFEKVNKGIQTGNLDLSVDIPDTTGGFREIANVINSSISIFKKAVLDTIAGVSNLEKGNFDFQIENEWKGDFDVIKEATNNTINTLRDFIEDVDKANLSMKDGDLN
jgi:methyl-accepting chemotaxis protein